jgi:hypothetical protein
MKYFMGNSFDKNIYASYMEVYEKVRYYNLLEFKQKSFVSNIRYYLKDVCDKMLDNCSKIENIIVIRDMLQLFEYIMYFDGVKRIDDDMAVFSALKEELSDKYDYVDDSYFKDFKCMVLKDRKCKKDFISKLDSSAFSLIKKRSNISNVYDAFIDYNISFPKLYSEYAIDRVFHSSIIYEDMVFILYYMVNKLVLENMIRGKFNDIYLVDFCVSLFKKRDKLRRVLNVVDNDISKEEIVFKIKYLDFLDYRDDVYELIKNGYKFSIILLSDDVIDEINFQKLGVFTYIINNGNMDNKLLRLDNVVVSR